MLRDQIIDALILSNSLNESRINFFFKKLILYKILYKEIESLSYDRNIIHFVSRSKS